MSGLHGLLGDDAYFGYIITSSQNVNTQGNRSQRIQAGCAGGSEFTSLPKLGFFFFSQNGCPTLRANSIGELERIQFHISAPESTVWTVNTRCFASKEDDTVSDGIVQRHLLSYRSLSGKCCALGIIVAVRFSEQD
jgi:hypothetical protein